MSTDEMVRTQGAPPTVVTRARRALSGLDRRFLPVLGTLLTLALMLGIGQQRYSTCLLYTSPSPRD